jgi:hypothetical protein
VRHPVLLAYHRERLPGHVLVGVSRRVVVDSTYPFAVAGDPKPRCLAVGVFRILAVDGHLFATPWPYMDRGVRGTFQPFQHHVLGIAPAANRQHVTGGEGFQTPCDGLERRVHGPRVCVIAGGTHNVSRHQPVLPGA